MFFMKPKHKHPINIADSKTATIPKEPCLSTCYCTVVSHSKYSSRYSGFSGNVFSNISDRIYLIYFISPKSLALAVLIKAQTDGYSF